MVEDCRAAKLPGGKGFAIGEGEKRLCKVAGKVGKAPFDARDQPSEGRNKEANGCVWAWAGVGGRERRQGLYPKECKCGALTVLGGSS